MESIADTPYLHSSHNASIALCHKFDMGGVCANTSDAANWRLLMQRFYTRAQALITKHNLSLIFVEDGSGAVDVTSPCLTALFSGWPSTYIPSDNTADGLFRNDTDTYRRMNLLNIEASSFYNVSALHYGKFPPSPYPFLLWEPSDQLTLTNYTEHYLQGERHAAGFRFAINIDPVQWAVYTGSATGDAWNQRREELRGRADPHQLLVTYDAITFLVILSTPITGGVGGDLTLTIFTIDALLSHRGLQWNATFPFTLAPENEGEIDSFTLAAGVGGTQMLVVGVRQNTSVSALLYPVPSLASWTSLKPLRVQTTIQSPTSAHALDAVWMTADTLTLVQASAINGTIVLQSFSIHIVTEQVTLSEVTSFIAGDVTGLAVAVAAGPYSEGESPCTAGVPGLLSFTLSNYSAYAAYYCVQNTSLYLSPSIAFTVGGTPSLSIQRSPAPDLIPHVLLTLSTSYCWNNEPYNKEADAGLCDHTPVPMASTLTYTYGTLAAVMEWIQRGGDGGVVCNREFSHGTYDLGGKQSAKLWVGMDEKGVERLGVIEVHEGANAVQEGAVGQGVQEGGVSGLEVRIGPSRICGVAIPFDGLVVDAWPLPLNTRWEEAIKREADAPQLPTPHSAEVRQA